MKQHTLLNFQGSALTGRVPQLLEVIHSIASKYLLDEKGGYYVVTYDPRHIMGPISLAI